MKRQEVLNKLGFSVPENKQKRVIIHSDVKNEADDHFAIMHHLLTPYIDVKGIIAGHFEWMSSMLPQFAKQKGISLEEVEVLTRDTIAARGTTMELSYNEGHKLLELAEIEDIPLYRGSSYEITDKNKLPESEGADFIIKEAMKEDDRPLYVALLGCTTDLAIAYLKEPKIADRLTAIWIGGGDYPDGGFEFNLQQDVEAARILFASPIKIWQVPKATYKTMEISLAELMKYVKPCGEIGRYLCEQMLSFRDRVFGFPGSEKRDFPHGESWCLGDNPTVSVLLQGEDRVCWHMEKAPIINDDMSYSANPDGKEIRVYDSIDTRMSMSDMFSKLELC
ncbi:nucleoside hydrolase [Neobacillus vireti]|uniref:nucleoside hydrolase n=1 Tax=Neobacillus vireti TaxID=220686 RepID=UPI002FFD75C6